MLKVRELFKKDIELCFEFDLNSVCLWSKKQWLGEFNKQGSKIFALFLSKKIIGVCVVQIVVDEAQLNYLSINRRFRRKGYGTYLMSHLIKTCEVQNLKKLSLEVSEINYAANKLYDNFNFLTVGRRIDYYKDGSNAFLKEKFL